MDLKDDYLELLKKTLTYSLWDPPPVPVSRFQHALPTWKRGLAMVLQRIFSVRGIQLVKTFPYSDDDIREGRVIPELAHTMIGKVRLDQLHDAIETILEEDVDGDLIEAGVWRGGACMLMRAVLKCHGVDDRKVFVADSFSGFPPPDLERHADDYLFENDRGADFLTVPLEKVRENFRAYGLLDEQVVFVPGFFESSLAAADIDRLSLIRVDADMFGSTLAALKELYPRLQAGGFCIVDDYAGFECRRAVDAYRQDNGIEEPIQRIDHSGIFWRKSS
ncbi:MAG TPA: TylF/MycF/NovP-related O-methyltransferase [Gammaproteobacteria bacterium]